MKKINKYIINLLIVYSLFFILLYFLKIYPFGINSLAKIDANPQYKPMLYSFIMKIKMGLSSSYTFNNGLGNPSFFNYLYYLSSPFNLISLIGKSPESMYFINILFKMGIAVITMTFYTFKRTNNEYLSGICSIFYIFSGWFIAYYFNIMWLDAFALLPLLQYGLEELIVKNKYNIYIFTLAFILISNFYTAYYICIYIFIYFIISIIFKKDKLVNKFKNFVLIGISTILAFSLAAFYIIPVIKAFMKMGLSDLTNTIDYFKISNIDLISSIINGNIMLNIGLSNRAMPNICLSSFCIISFIYYFFNKNEKIGNRIKIFIIFIFVVFIIKSPYLNYIINGFYVPAGLPIRHSFIISFCIILLFIRNYNSFDGFNKRMLIPFFIYIILGAFLYITDNISSNIYYMNCIFSIIYLLYILFIKRFKFMQHSLIIIVALEALTCLFFSFNSLELIYDGPAQINQDILKYRTTYYNCNDNLYTNTPSINNFSSTNYTKVLNMLYNFGLVTDDKSTITYAENSYSFDMLFNIKNNKYYLEKIYAVDKDILNYKFQEHNVSENQINLIKSMSNISDILINKKIKAKKVIDNVAVFKVKKKDRYMFNFSDDIDYVAYNDTLYRNYYYKGEILEELYDCYVETYESEFLVLDLNKGDEVYIKYADDNNIWNVYVEDSNKLKELYEILSKQQILFNIYENDYLEGYVDVLDNQVIFTTIPYDENWEVYVDDKKVNKEIVLDSLIAINCEKGRHKVVFKYKENNFWSFFISGLTLLVLGLNKARMMIKNKKSKF